MSCGDEVKVLSPLLLEASELDELITHHIGIGRQASTYRIDGVLDDILPVLLVEGDYLKWAVIATSEMAYDLQIILPRAVGKAFFFHPDLDIEEGGTVACFA